MVGEKGWGNRGRNMRILVGILASCAVVVAIASMAEDHLRSEDRKRTFALHSAAIAPGSGGEEGKRVKLTPRLAREILDLPEGDQQELVMRPGNQVKQMHILEHVVLSADEHAGEDDGSDDGGEDHQKNERHGLEEHHAHHDASPAQMRVQRQWALIFVTAIATASVVFETLKEITIERTPPTMIRVVEKFFGELATLGFIGTISFVLTTDFGDSPSVLGGLSFTYTGDSHLLVHEFHTLHFLVFFVMIFFVGAVLVTLHRAVGQNVTWSRYQSDFDELLQNKDLKPHDMQQIMFTPHIAEGVVGTVTHEYLMSDHVRRALFLCARQRFIDDTETSVKIPPDFDFALYLTMRISSILAEVVEIGVYDWIALWLVYLVIFIVNAGVQHWTRQDGDVDSLIPIYVVIAFFMFLQTLAMLGSFAIFRMLGYINHMLTPYVASGNKGGVYGSFKLISPKDIDLQKGDVRSHRAESYRVALKEPAYIKKMKLVRKESGMTHTERIFSLVFPARMANRHEQLFGVFGQHGPHHVLRFIKLCLLFSVISISCLVTIFAPYFWGVSPVLFFLAFIPPCVTIVLTPRMVVVYTMACSTEMMKDSNTIIQVVRKQKQDKLINVLRVLSMLSYFLDQIEFLKKISDNGGDVSDEGAISDERWNQLVAATDPKVIEDLEALFNAFDDDHSGELDEEEVGLLVSQMGTRLSPEENHNLFRIMDADGGGTVSFREFATVILHQKNSTSGNLNFDGLGEKMFAIFDQDGSGSVSQQEIIDQMMKMGKNWDHASLMFFLQELDKDGDGEIEKEEFIAYIRSIEAEVKD